MRFSVHYRCLIAGAILAVSCSEQTNIDMGHTPTLLSIDGSCNTYVIDNAENTSWEIVGHPEWITPITPSGTGAEEIKIYVESNSTVPVRSGKVEVRYADGNVETVPVTQSDEKPTFDLQRTNGLGWSFDVRTYMDSRGLKNQIFNLQKLYNYNHNAYVEEPNSSESIEYYIGSSKSNLSNDITAKLDLGGKFGAFKLDINGNFGMNTSNESKRIFSWIHGLYCERLLRFNNLDFGEIANEDIDVFTAEFAAERRHVIEAGADEASLNRLVSRFGTHYIEIAYLGGTYDYYYSSVVNTTIDNIKIEGAIKFGYGSKFGLNVDGKYANDFKNISNEVIEKFSVKGGDNVEIANKVVSGSAQQADTDNWLKSLEDKDKQELIYFTLKPISELFPEEMESKIVEYFDRMYYNEVPITRCSIENPDSYR